MGKVTSNRHFLWGVDFSTSVQVGEYKDIGILSFDRVTLYAENKGEEEMKEAFLNLFCALFKDFLATHLVFCGSSSCEPYVTFLFLTLKLPDEDVLCCIMDVVTVICFLLLF